MKRIKIRFVGFWGGFNEKDNFLTKILSERYKIEFSEQPDYVIASIFGKPYEYCKYDCVRILYTGEPFFPDMNLFDFAIGFDDFHLKGYIEKNQVDRYYRYPLAFLGVGNPIKTTASRTNEEAIQILKNKKKFCSFITGHETYKGEREKLFEAINKYKHVDSAGSYMNNMKDGFVVPFTNEKIDFLKQYKFTIAAESLQFPGFVTEKITQAFQADCIPIYIGNPDIDKEFNVESFIWCQDINKLDDVVEKIKAIDCNDELYIQMIMKQKVKEKDYVEKLYQGLKDFLWKIFDADKDHACQRIKAYMPEVYEKQCLDYYKVVEKRVSSLGYQVKQYLKTKTNLVQVRDLLKKSLT